MKLLKEPLLHFLLLGVLVFGIHAWRQRDRTDAEADHSKRIEVNAAVITRLREGWTRQFQRTPDAADMQGMVEAHIKEEVLCREALAMGLDREDSIVRRRMAQKMEFLTQDIATAAAPGEAALEQYFTQHAARYAESAQVSFRHVYFSKERRGARLETDVSAALSALSQPGASDEAFGDPFLHGFEFEEQREQDIAASFGSDFAAAVLQAPVNAWSGPFASSYGLHLVRVTGRGEPRPAELSLVRDAVQRDFLDERRRAANDAVLARLKEDYEIVVDDAALKAASGEATGTPKP